MKGPRHWRTPDLPGRFTWVQPFLMCLCISTKTLKNVDRVSQPALPNFRTVDGFALSPSVIQCARHLALRPNNINNKNKDKKPERGLTCWCFQALRQWSERDLGKSARWLDQNRGTGGIKGDLRAACRRVMSPETCNYTGRMQNQGRYKREERQ